MAEERHNGSGETAPTTCADRPGTDQPGNGPRTPVPPEDVIDESVLHDLVQDLGQPAAQRLAEQYGAGLKRRLELLTVASLDRSVRAVYDTAVDLAVTGAMVGAVALAQAAWAVSQDVVRSRTIPQVDALEQLMRLAHDTETALIRHCRSGIPGP